MKQHLLMGLALICLAMAGCQSAPPPASELSAITSRGFVKQWQADLGSARDPIVELHLAGDSLVVYTRDNNSFWLGGSGGQLLGMNRVIAPGHSAQPPVVLGDRVVIPTTASLEVFDKTGKRIDSKTSPRVLESPAAGAGDSLFIGVAYPGSGRLARISVGERLQLEWELYMGAAVVAAPAIVGEDVFAAGTDGRVWAVTLGRAPVWGLSGGYFQTDGPVTADVAADEAGVYVASQDNKLYCLERISGKIRWIYYAGLPLVDGPVILGNLVIQRLPGGGIVALNKTEGKFAREPIWTQTMAEQVLAADDTHVYVRAGGSSIVALNKATGQPQFRSSRPDLAVFATNLHTPMIYAATRSGSVFGIKPVLTPGAVGEVVFEKELLAEPVALTR